MTTRKDYSSDDVQVGSGGLSFQEVALAYNNPGGVLQSIRELSKKSLEDVAKSADIRAATLLSYEAGKNTPTLPEVTALAKALGADLRKLLELFGHVKMDAAESGMGIAAKFAGDLDPSERDALRQIVADAVRKGSR